VWDVDMLLAEIRAGLADAAAKSPLRSVAIDSWAVDYGLLDAQGALVGPVHAYRSSRTDGVMATVRRRVGAERIYAATGIQFLAFNTAYQLVTEAGSAQATAARQFLMVPDLVNHALCGSTTNEVTNASTTQLLDAVSHEWHDRLIAELGLRRDLFPALHSPGTRLGSLADGDGVTNGEGVTNGRGVVKGHGPGRRGELARLDVVACASHDTASAVAGTPMRADRPGIYISCGTWSLVGCELHSPVTTADALAANVTNELGVGGTTRLLKNVTGLWLLEESCRAWRANGADVSLTELVGVATALPGGRSVFDVDDARFGSPGQVPEHIAAACRATGQPVPDSPSEVTRAILDSLALAWRRTVATIERIAGIRADVIHLVGGGAANALLGELCASACERPVLAGPVEATVVGNALVQAIADGVIPDLAAGRALVERTMPPRWIQPRRTLDWAGLDTRLAPSGTTHGTPTQRS
jgi:rhamnulokinase